MNKWVIAGIGLLTYLVADIRIITPEQDQYFIAITTHGISGSKLLLVIDCKSGNFSYHYNK